MNIVQDQIRSLFIFFVYNLDLLSLLHCFFIFVCFFLLSFVLFRLVLFFSFVYYFDLFSLLHCFFIFVCFFLLSFFSFCFFFFFSFIYYYFLIFFYFISTT